MVQEKFLKKSAVRHFKNNIFESKEGVYIASCCCYSVILKFTFQNFISIVIQILLIQAGRLCR